MANDDLLNEMHITRDAGTYQDKERRCIDIRKIDNGWLVTYSIVGHGGNFVTDDPVRSLGKLLAEIDRCYEVARGYRGPQDPVPRFDRNAFLPGTVRSA